MKFLDYLVDHSKTIYCASSLFSPLTRIEGYNLAQAFEESASSRSQAHNNYQFTFLPFKDTYQSDLVGDSKARKIFELDIQHLEKSGALVARVDGIAKDSGVCMELGYAYALGIPIGLICTDFIWSYYTKDQQHFAFDPMLLEMSTFGKQFTSLPQPVGYYGGQNYMLEYQWISQFTEECLEEFDSLIAFETPLMKQYSKNKIYVDIEGGKYEWARNLQDRICNNMNQWKVMCSKASRYVYSRHKNTERRVKDDLQSALGCTIAVFSADNIEMDAGSAALFGVCTKLGITTILLYTSQTIIEGTGGQKMRLNLMIDQAACAICTSYEELVNTLTAMVET